MQRKASIESEFDEPLREVVAGFAKMGHSRPLTAETLEVSVESLKSYCRRQRIHFRRSPMEHREIRGRPGRMITHEGRTQSLSAWAYEFGVAPCTVHKRLRTRGRIC